MTWSPSHADYLELISAQNPWQVTGQVPESLAPKVERPLAQFLWQAIDTPGPSRFRVILGPRRVGKTTVMYQTVARALTRGVPTNRVLWLRLDHPLLSEQPLGRWLKTMVDATGASEAQPAFVFLDELTYADDWDRWLKTFWDERWPVRLVATSSSSAALRQGRVESGVGRWEEDYLPPWLFSEYLALRGKDSDVVARPTLRETIDANLSLAVGDVRSER